MAVEVGHAVVPIKPDLSGFQAGVARETEGAMGGLRNFAKNAAITLGGAFAVTKVVDFARGAVDAASNMNETVSKSRTIFGDSSGAIERWASGAAGSIGQSEQQALDAAGTFGNMFTQLGIGTDQAAGMSTSMVDLASDFASFHNADISEVLTAQQAAFRGEYDALQRFVPTINAAAVEQEALRATGKKTTKELTLQEKALAVQALMMEGAGDAAGDFARTSDGLANKQRIASAQWKDMQARIGKGLIPVMTALVGFVTGKLVPAFGAVVEVIGDIVKWITEHEEVLIGLGVAIAATVVPAFIGWAGAAAAAAAATVAAHAPVILITALIAALVAGVIWAYQNWDWFREAVDKVARFLTQTVWPAIKAGADWITDTLIPAIGDVIEWFGALLSKAAEIATGIGEKIGDIVGFFTGLPGRLADAAGDVFGFLRESFKSALNWIIRGWNSVEFKIPGFDPPGPGPKFGGFVLGLPDIPEFATGGVVPGPVGAPQLALVHGGETVLTPDQMADRGEAPSLTIIGQPGEWEKAIARHLARSVADDYQRGLAARLG